VARKRKVIIGFALLLLLGLLAVLYKELLIKPEANVPVVTKKKMLKNIQASQSRCGLSAYHAVYDGYVKGIYIGKYTETLTLPKPHVYHFSMQADAHFLIFYTNHIHELSTGYYDSKHIQPQHFSHTETHGHKSTHFAVKKPNTDMRALLLQVRARLIRHQTASFPVSIQKDAKGSVDKFNLQLNHLQQSTLDTVLGNHLKVLKFIHVNRHGNQLVDYLAPQFDYLPVKSEWYKSDGSKVLTLKLQQIIPLASPFCLVSTKHSQALDSSWQQTLFLQKLKSCSLGDYKAHYILQRPTIKTVVGHYSEMLQLDKPGHYSYIGLSQKDGVSWLKDVIGASIGNYMKGQVSPRYYADSQQVKTYKVYQKLLPQHLDRMSVELMLRLSLLHKKKSFSYIPVGAKTVAEKKTTINLQHLKESTISTVWGDVKVVEVSVPTGNDLSYRFYFAPAYAYLLMKAEALKETKVNLVMSINKVVPGSSSLCVVSAGAKK
jgi:hypothetical protein